MCRFPSFPNRNTHFSYLVYHEITIFVLKKPLEDPKDMKTTFILAFLLTALSASAQNLRWGSTDVRYPQVPNSSLSETGREEGGASLSAWKGEMVNAQALLTSQQALDKVTFKVTDLRCGRNVIPSGNITCSIVREVITDTYKSRKDSVLSADRLEETPTTSVEAGQTVAVWVTIQVPTDAEAGTYKGRLEVDAPGFQSPSITLCVGKRTLPHPSQWAFHLDLWQNPYAVARYFNVPLWSQEHFDRMRPLMTRLARAGQKVITCSIIQHPWNSQTYDPFKSMIAKMKQLDGTWKYDYTVFDRWVRFMMECGITEQIDCYTLVPWQYEFDYYDCATNSTRKIACKPEQPEYRDFALPFLRDFAAHLKAMGWFHITCIAMDERPKAQMEAALRILREADPDYRIEGAANYNVDSEAGDQVHDLSVGYRYNLLTPEVLARRNARGQKITFYTCCNPERPNTFTFSPPAESAFLGWHAMACGYNGYLRWAYNSWPSNPCVDSRFGSWAGGDTFLVYPEGSSIRFQRLMEGIQAYEKIRILRQELRPRQRQQLEDMLQRFSGNKYDVDAASLLKEANQLIDKLSSSK